MNKILQMSVYQRSHLIKVWAAANRSTHLMHFYNENLRNHRVCNNQLKKESHLNSKWIHHPNLCNPSSMMTMHIQIKSNQTENLEALILKKKWKIINRYIHKVCIRDQMMISSLWLVRFNSVRNLKSRLIKIFIIQVLISSILVMINSNNRSNRFSNHNKTNQSLISSLWMYLNKMYNRKIKANRHLPTSLIQICGRRLPNLLPFNTTHLKMKTKLKITSIFPNSTMRIQLGSQERVEPQNNWWMRMLNLNVT